VQAANDGFEQTASFAWTPSIDRYWSTYVQTAIQPEQLAQPKIAKADGIVKNLPPLRFLRRNLLDLHAHLRRARLAAPLYRPGSGVERVAGRTQKPLASGEAPGTPLTQGGLR
jgi:hypothetical protein